MARYKNESPSPEQQKFINLLAVGEVSQTEAHKLAGYSGDRGNAARLARKFAAEIAVAREKLGLAPVIKPEIEEIEDEDVRGLVEQNRRLYEAAVAAGDIKSARKSLTALERLLKKKKPKDKATAPTAKRSSAHVPVDWDAVYELVFTPEENAAYEAEIAAGREIERHRQLWLSGKPNRYMELQYPRATSRTLEHGTVVLDFESETDAAVKSNASPIDLEQAEIVKRL